MGVYDMFFKSYVRYPCCVRLPEHISHTSRLMRPGSLADVRPVGKGISRDLNIFPIQTSFRSTWACLGQWVFSS